MRMVLLVLLTAVTCRAQAPNSIGNQKPEFVNRVAGDGSQISVEVRFVTATPQLFEQLKADDLIRSQQPKKSQILPNSSDEELAQQGGIQLVSATTVVEQRQPVFVRSLTEAQTRKFIQVVESDERSNILFAPKVTLFDQQDAVIQDTTHRPFVVGLKEAGADYQPQIETVDDGIKVAMKTTVKGRDVRLDLAIRLSEITSVMTQSAGPKNVSIQVPSVKATTVELSALLAEGKTLAIYGLHKDRQIRQQQPVPYVGKVPYVGRLFKNTALATESVDLLVLITPRIVKP